MRNKTLRLLLAAALLIVASLITQARTNEEKAALNNHLTTYLNTDYPSAVTDVEVTADKVIIKGNCSGNGQFVLVELTPADDVTEDSTYIHRTNLTQSDFTVSLDRHCTYDGIGYDRLLSRWAIIDTSSGNDILVSHAHYADKVATISNPEPLIPTSKKGFGAGLGDLYMQDVVDCNVHYITINWVLTTFIAQNPIWANNIPYPYEGKEYYIDGGMIAAWDNYLRFYQLHNVSVSAILLITPTASDPSLTDLFRHPENNGGNYTMPNMTTMESVNLYAAILNYLASRYNSNTYGRIHHWIMHNEVDAAKEWTNMGDQPELVYNDTYIKSMRMCYNIVRQYDQNASVMGSYTHCWTKGYDSADFAPKKMLEQTVKYSQLEGDFLWGVAYHPYPQNLTLPEFWKNDGSSIYSLNSEYVTFKNLEVINEWIKLPQNLYQGMVKRNLFLSENGTNSPTYSDRDLALQAAGGCWAWKKTNALDGIDAIMWHNWMDNREEGGLRIGLRFFPDDETNPGGAKPVWYVWQNADTPNEDSFFEQYKTYLGINDWSEIFQQMQGTGNVLNPNYYYIIEAEDYDTGGKSVAYDNNMTTPVSDYRSDSEDANISPTSSMSGGYGIFDMGASTESYNLDEWVDPSSKTISPDMAIKNWGSWYNYTIFAPEDMYVDINIKYNLKWVTYGKIAAYGLEPGTNSYQIDGAPELNWPKHYTGSMILMLDGNNLKTTQTSRPIAPDEYQSTGSNFTKIVKDTTNWHSTLVNGTEPNDTLWMWPVQGRANTLTSRYNATPDYKDVFLSKGAHTFRIKSLCSSWNYDCMKIVINQTSGLHTLNSTNKRDLNVYGGRGTIIINEKPPVTIYDINGRQIAKATTTVSVPSGIYIVKGEQSSKKVIVN